jgi:hypothetical protein
MDEYMDPAAALRANRRKEIFRAVRGDKLTGQRTSWSGELMPLSAARPAKAATTEEPPQRSRRLRLGATIEDEADGAQPGVPPRYFEPND